MNTSIRLCFNINIINDVAIFRSVLCSVIYTLVNHVVFRYQLKNNLKRASIMINCIYVQDYRRTKRHSDTLRLKVLIKLNQRPIGLWLNDVQN